MKNVHGLQNLNMAYPKDSNKPIDKCNIDKWVVKLHGRLLEL